MAKTTQPIPGARPRRAALCGCTTFRQCPRAQGRAVQHQEENVRGLRLGLLRRTGEVNYETFLGIGLGKWWKSDLSVNPLIWGGLFFLFTVNIMNFVILRKDFFLLYFSRNFRTFFHTWLKVRWKKHILRSKKVMFVRKAYFVGRFCTF